MPTELPLPDMLLIFKALPGANLLLSPALLIEAASDEYLAVALTTREQLVGRFIFEAFPDNPAASQAHGSLNLRASLEQVLATGQPHQMTQQHYDVPDPARPGHFLQRYWLPTNRPVLDAEGRVIHIIHTVVDVTDQRSADHLLRDSQAAEVDARAQTEQQRQRFHEVLMQLPAYVAVYHGPDHVYQFVNPPYQSMFPYRAFPGRTLGEAMPEANGLGVAAVFDRVYQTGEPYHFPELEGWFDFKGTGEPEQVFLNLHLQPLRNAQGQVDGVLDYSHNVTEQVRARRQVEQLNAELETRVAQRTREALALQADLLAAAQGQAQERETQRGELQRLFEQAPVAVAVFCGPQYVIELANSSVCALWGRTPQQALGTPLFELLPEAAGQGFEQLLDQVRTTGEPFVAHELPALIDRNGRRETVYWNFVYAPLREADGTIERVTVVATDGTEQVLARRQVHALNEALTTTNAELNRTNTQLTRTNVDLDTFVYAASHDLKAPIANVEGLLNALRDYLPDQAQDPMVPQLLAMMQGAIGRFQQTVGHLTDISRLQDPPADQPAEDLDLAQALEDVRLDLLPLLESSRAEVAVAVEACTGVRFSAQHLRSVLFNLLSNAVKYRAPDRSPVVQVRTRCTATQLVLEVQDNGLGLSAQQQGQLFAMFRRLHTHVEGSGVGLYLIKRTIENAGGTLTVQSQPNVGSTFTVTLPRI